MKSSEQKRAAGSTAENRGGRLSNKPFLCGCVCSGMAGLTPWRRSSRLTSSSSALMRKFHPVLGFCPRAGNVSVTFCVTLAGQTNLQVVLVMMQKASDTSKDLMETRHSIINRPVVLTVVCLCRFPSAGCLFLSLSTWNQWCLRGELAWWRTPLF